MTTKIFLLITTLVCTSLSYSQSNWITLSYPQSDIFGKAVNGLQNGDLNFTPLKPKIENIKLDESQSSDEMNEYNQQFKNFISKYFSSEKFSLTQVKAKKLIIKSLNYETIKKLTTGDKYIFSALSADSVEVIVKSKKSKDVNYSKAIKDIAALIKGDKVVEVVTKIIPLFDSISTHKEDTLSFKMTLANPNVYYKVKLIKFKGITRHDWDNKYWKNFSNPNGIIKTRTDVAIVDQPAFNLVYTPLEDKNSTVPPIYPEVWGGGDPKDKKVRLTTKKINNELKLFIQYTNSIDGAWNDYEVQSETIDGKKYWKLDRILIYSFEIGNITKLVYVQVRGEENGKDTIMIKSWGSSLQDKLTFMQYPEMKFKYLKK